MKVPEKHRDKNYSTSVDGCNGLFHVLHDGNIMIYGRRMNILMGR